MRSPGSVDHPELMSIAQSLRKFISKNKIEDYETVLSPLNIMLGMENKHPIEWNYLNKGTHEEEREEEFDRTVVKEIMELLEQVDDILSK
jgi:hypothetical protein